MLKRVLSWLRALLRWLGEAYLVWTALGVVALALVFSFRSGASEIEIRLAGMILQLLGIGTVAYGVRETRKLFGRPSYMELVRTWVSRFPRWRRKVVAITGSASLTVSGGSVRIEAWGNVDPAGPLQVQVDALKQNVERLRERQHQMQNEIDAMHGKQSEALRQEEQVRAKNDKEIQQRLEAAQTGGLHITFMGAVWLFVGVVLTTFSPEIARRFGSLG